MMRFVHSFFSQLDRIATPNYEPNDDDIVRARLRTLTITEHRLKFEYGQCSITFLLYSHSCYQVWRWGGNGQFLTLVVQERT